MMGTGESRRTGQLSVRRPHVLVFSSNTCMPDVRYACVVFVCKYVRGGIGHLAQQLGRAMSPIEVAQAASERQRQRSGNIHHRGGGVWGSEIQTASPPPATAGVFGTPLRIASSGEYEELWECRHAYPIQLPFE